MKLKLDFCVREIVGEYVMIPMGDGALKFSGMISTSETGVLLAEELKKDVTRTDLLNCLLENYDVDEETASADLNEFLSNLRKFDLLIE